MFSVFLNKSAEKTRVFKDKIGGKMGTKPQKAAVASSFLVNNLSAASCTCVCILLLSSSDGKLFLAGFPPAPPRNFL